VDKAKFPHSRVVVKGNLVAVVAPTEWEAIRASQQVAADTKWTEWSGLPGHEKLHDFFRKGADWNAAPVTVGGTPATAVSPPVAKTLSATYDLPYMKHAPIGPAVAVADVRKDGTVYLHTNNQNPSMLRGSIARMLGTPVDNVIIRSHPGSGHYGRSNGGHGGAEDEAVILSKAVGSPVRVQWMRPEDMQWSTNGTGAYSTIDIGVDASGTIASYRADHYMPAFHDDRPVGALIAGLPTISAPDVKAPPENFPVVGTTVNQRWDPWIYDSVPKVLEQCYGTFQVGEKESPIAVGLRNHSMRTPGQFSQHIPREAAMTEAAALAGIDPLQFRLDNTNDPRLKNVLTAVRDASGWQGRASVRASSNAAQLRGWGVAAMKRGAYWACVAEVTIDRATGKVAVEKCVVAVDCGIVINPLQLKRQVQGGALMGISHVLHEEVTFDRSGITNRDWRTYPILTMGEAPYVDAVIVTNPTATVCEGASEAANTLPPPAIVAAVFDAIGRPVRRLPLTPAFVKGLLSA
jgi:CO/xanthine dehydrogenase Mo-binding subunit